MLSRPPVDCFRFLCRLRYCEEMFYFRCGGAGRLRYRTGFGVDAEVNANVAVNSSRLFQATDGVHKPLYHTWRLNLYRSDP